MKSISYKSPYLLTAISFLLYLPNCFSGHFVALSKKGHRWEQFDPSLTLRLRSVQDVLHYTDSIALATNVKTGTLDYGNIVSRTIRKRFYHGYSYYGLNENWIAAIAGATLWSNLAAIVSPDDILQYPMAACSQQSIVMMECFKQRNIPYRKVGFTHHFTLEGKFNKRWYYFDPDMEPDFRHFPRTGIDSIIKVEGLSRLYQNILDSAEIKEYLANYFTDKPNIAPAPNATLFHSITKFFSKTAFTLPFIFGFFAYRRKKIIVNKKTTYNTDRVAA